MANPLIKFVESVCTQVAVYWGNPHSDGVKTVFDEPIEIKCRWDGVNKWITNDRGEQIISRAEVLITEDVAVGGMLYLGALTDLDSSQETAPETVENAYRIQKVDKSPLFQSTSEFVRVAYL